MGISEEEQMAAMLEEMGLDSIDPLEEGSDISNPMPKAPVRRKESVSLAAEATATTYESSEQKTDLLEQNDSDSRSVSSESVFKNTSKTANNRELTISSLVHLMGLPTAVQTHVLDTKLDLISTKLMTIQSKIERIQSQLDLISNTSPIERIEFQITEMRSIMKKFFPQAFQGTLSSSTLVSTQPKAQMLSSKPTQKETKIVTSVTEKSEEEEIEEEALSDEDYQVLEAAKLREKK